MNCQVKSSKATQPAQLGSLYLLISKPYTLHGQNLSDLRKTRVERGGVSSTCFSRGIRVAEDWIRDRYMTNHTSAFEQTAHVLYHGTPNNDGEWVVSHPGFQRDKLRLDLGNKGNIEQSKE
jgi:hypothetical protein